MDVQATPIKGQRTAHQHSRSGAAPTPTKTNNEHIPKSTNRRRQHHGGQPPSQQAPVWDNATNSDVTEGYFDAKGRYVSGQQDSSAPDESPAPAKGKKARGKHHQIDHTPQQPAHPHMAAAQAIAAGTPAKMAYAGPTFHASPAPSTLPKPSFMSKSVPGDAKPSTLQERLEQENGNARSAASSMSVIAENKPAAVAPAREESPLDFFFKADRAEKAKSQTPNEPATPNVKAYQTVAQSAPPGNNWSNIYQHGSAHHQRTDSARSQQGMFALELDGTGIQPGRSPNQQVATPQAATAPRPSSQAEDDPIRRFLMQTANGSSPYPQASLQPPQHNSGYDSDQPGASPFYRPSPVQRSSSGPSTPLPTHQPPPSNLHYGNRNLSPLFQAAKSPPNTAPSQLRRELSTSPPVFNGPHQQWSSIYQQRSGQQLTPPPDRFTNPATPTMAPRSHSYDPQTNNGTNDTKSMEDDLRRILKLTASSGGATGVQG